MARRRRQRFKPRPVGGKKSPGRGGGGGPGQTPGQVPDQTDQLLPEEQPVSRYTPQAPTPGIPSTGMPISAPDMGLPDDDQGYARGGMVDPMGYMNYAPVAKDLVARRKYSPKHTGYAEGGAIDPMNYMPDPLPKLGHHQSSYDPYSMINRPEPIISPMYGAAAGELGYASGGPVGGGARPSYASAVPVPAYTAPSYPAPSDTPSGGNAKLYADMAQQRDQTINPKALVMPALPVLPSVGGGGGGASVPRQYLQQFAGPGGTVPANPAPFDPGPGAFSGGGGGVSMPPLPGGSNPITNLLARYAKGYGFPGGGGSSSVNYNTFSMAEGGEVPPKPEPDMQGYMGGANAMPSEELDEVLQKIAQLNPGASDDVVNLSAIVTAAKTGDMARAASILAGFRRRFDNLNAHAQGAMAHGDPVVAAKLAAKAHSQIPDGLTVNYTVAQDGSVMATISPSGQTFTMSPQQFHDYLVGPATSFDHLMENGLEKNLQIASGGQRQGGNTGYQSGSQDEAEAQEPEGYAEGGDVKNYEFDKLFDPSGKFGTETEGDPGFKGAFKKMMENREGPYSDAKMVQVPNNTDPGMPVLGDPGPVYPGGGAPISSSTPAAPGVYAEGGQVEPGIGDRVSQFYRNKIGDAALDAIAKVVPRPPAPQGSLPDQLGYNQIPQPKSYAEGGAVGGGDSQQAVRDVLDYTRQQYGLAGEGGESAGDFLVRQAQERERAAPTTEGELGAAKDFGQAGDEGTQVAGGTDKYQAGLVDQGFTSPRYYNSSEVYMPGGGGGGRRRSGGGGGRRSSGGGGGGGGGDTGVTLPTQEQIAEDESLGGSPAGPPQQAGAPPLPDTRTQEEKEQDIYDARQKKLQPARDAQLREIEAERLRQISKGLIQPGEELRNPYDEQILRRFPMGGGSEGPWGEASTPSTRSYNALDRARTMWNRKYVLGAAEGDQQLTNQPRGGGSFVSPFSKYPAGRDVMPSDREGRSPTMQAETGRRPLTRDIPRSTNPAGPRSGEDVRTSQERFGNIPGPRFGTRAPAPLDTTLPGYRPETQQVPQVLTPGQIRQNQGQPQQGQPQQGQPQQGQPQKLEKPQLSTRPVQILRVRPRSTEQISEELKRLNDAARGRYAAGGPVRRYAGGGDVSADDDTTLIAPTSDAGYENLAAARAIAERNQVLELQQQQERERQRQVAAAPETPVPPNASLGDLATRALRKAGSDIADYVKPGGGFEQGVQRRHEAITAPLRGGLREYLGAPPEGPDYSGVTADEAQRTEPRYVPPAAAPEMTTVPVGRDVTGADRRFVPYEQAAQVAQQRPYIPQPVTRLRGGVSNLQPRDDDMSPAAQAQRMFPSAAQSGARGDYERQLQYRQDYERLQRDLAGTKYDSALAVQQLRGDQEFERYLLKLQQDYELAGHSNAAKLIPIITAAMRKDDPLQAIENLPPELKSLTRNIITNFMQRQQGGQGGASAGAPAGAPAGVPAGATPGSYAPPAGKQWIRNDKTGEITLWPP